MICANLNSLCPISNILSFFSFLTPLTFFPFSTSAIVPPPYSFPTHILPLHIYSPFSFQLLCLLGYLLTVQVDATV